MSSWHRSWWLKMNSFAIEYRYVNHTTPLLFSQNNILPLFPAVQIDLLPCQCTVTGKRRRALQRRWRLRSRSMRHPAQKRRIQTPPLSLRMETPQVGYSLTTVIDVKTKMHSSLFLIVFFWLHVSEMDEEDCERRRMECLDEMSNLEKQFTDLKDQ